MSERCAIPPCGWCSSKVELQRLDVLRQLDRFKCPTLVVAGEDDPITPIADIEDVVAAMRPELTRFVRFTNAGHGVYRDRPADFFREVRDFIAS
jgi:pimeloyl-ACP methyl ester carboxylesterase